MQAYCGDGNSIPCLITPPSKNTFMRQLISIILISFLLLSCGQNTTSQEERELQQKELESKEKEKLSRDSAEQKTNPATTVAPALQISPLDDSGDLGQVTFSQNEKTVFYYNLNSKKGKVKLNDKEYILDRYSFDSNSGSYTLSGNGVSISAPDCKYDAPGEGDCGYGKFSTVIIKLGTGILKLTKVEIQDCPAY
jgi:hypothetical protein